MLYKTSCRHTVHRVSTICSRSRQIRHSHLDLTLPKGDDLGPTREDEHRTFRVRKDKAGRELPLPPLLDPVVINRRARWEQPKNKPNHAEFTPFQRKLQMNPYAHILASKTRSCCLNSLPLPAKLLTSLHARPHPETRDPWLLPVSLTTSDKHLGPPFYFLTRKNVAKYLGKKKVWQRALSNRMLDKLGPSVVKNLVWREDMPDLILQLLRKDLFASIIWFFGRNKRLFPVASPRSEDIDAISDVACILIVGTLRTRADELHARVNKIQSELERLSSQVAQGLMRLLDPHAAPHVTHNSPFWYVEPAIPRLQPRIQYPELEFKTTQWQGKRIPVYSLTDLLGEEKTKELLQDDRWAGVHCVAMKQARHTVEPQIQLLQLQAYLSQPGP